MDNFLFIGLPYAAFILLVVGWINKSRNRSFQISSLSTQFLEGKKLFWGTQAFHWGIIAILLGHLIGFLVPSAVLAWNGEPVRLLILETSALMFGLASFVGVILLIIRRITNKRISVVTSKADYAVYAILFVQILTGLWIALGYRWGSSWYASTMTPYLWSIIKLSPDVAAISAMPFVVKTHVASAALLIGMIPFTRFSHFMTFPIRYYWRIYQITIWNRDPKTKRSSTEIEPGVRSKNN